jgi:hypothetical protein
VVRSKGTPHAGLRRVAAEWVIVTALTCLGACAPSGEPGIAARHRHGASYSLGHWVGPLGGAECLSFGQYTDSTFAERVLIVTPNGAAVVLSSLANAPTGEMRDRIAAAGGDWWLEVRETDDLKMERFDEFVDETWRIKKRLYSLECSDGARVESDSMQGLVEALGSLGRFDAVRKAVPKDVVKARRFLYAITGPNGEYAALGPTVLVLARLFGEEMKTDTSWKLVTEHFRKGLIVRDPGAIRFMAGFRSVVAEQPLGEFDAERALVMPSTIEGIRRAREYRKLHPPDAPLERLHRAQQRVRAGLSPWG